MRLGEDRLVDVEEGTEVAPARPQAHPHARRPAKAVAAARHRGVRRRPPVKRLVLAAVLLGAAAYGGHLGYDWWTDGRFLVTTDDAYVQGDITVLASNAVGYVTDFDVENNQRVRAGDVIARIDDGDYRLALEASENRLATQQSSIARIGRETEAAQAGIARAEASLDAAQAEQTHAEAEFVRQNQLVRTDFTSRSKMDEAVWDRARSHASVRAAEASLAAEHANVDV